jgi:hypothetical protein
MDMRLGERKVRSLYRVGSLKTVASELVKHNLDLVAVQEVRRLRLVVSQQIITQFSI